jgi:hypothetical protein
LPISPGRPRCKDRGGPHRGGRIQAQEQRHTPRRVNGKLREAGVELAKGAAVAQVCKGLAIIEQTYCRWREEYGRLRLDQTRRLKDLEKENVLLKRLLAEAELDKVRSNARQPIRPGS